MQNKAKREAAKDDLRKTQSKNVLSESPQAARLKLQTDDEQQQRDADLGDAGKLLRILNETQDLRADECTSDDVTEGRAEPQPPEQGDENERGAEHDRAAFQDRGRCFGRLRRRRHRADSIAASKARNGSRIAACRALRRFAPARDHASPARPPHPRMVLCSQALRSRRARATSARSRPLRAVPSGRRRPVRMRRHVPDGTRFDPRRSVELHRNLDAASAGWRANLRMTILPLEIARFRQRRGEPQDIGGVEGRVHWLVSLPTPRSAGGTILQDDAV